MARINRKEVNMARILGLRYEKGKLLLKQINKDEFLKESGRMA